jgi:bud site selection protein 31
MANVRRKLKGKKPPEGWELIEEVIEDFEVQMKDAVNEGDEGKRKAELSWKIHRLHWEKNRFIFDLMYQRKVMSKELVSENVAVVKIQGSFPSLEDAWS